MRGAVSAMMRPMQILPWIRRLLLISLLVAWPALADTMRSGSFAVEFHPDDRLVANLCLDYLEEAQQEFAARLPLGEGMVRVIVAHTVEEFAQHAGSFGELAVSGVARPAEGLIILKAAKLRMPGDDFRGTVRHELVHILLHRNTNTQNLPRWLNEGLCMSLANEYYWRSVFQIATMFVQNRIIDYRFLDMTFRAPGDEMDFGDAYAQGLSMTRFLRDHLGEDKFWRVIYAMREGSFNDALQREAGWSLAGFWDAYTGSLWRVALIGSIASGSLFLPIAGLVIVAWLKQQWRNGKILRSWAREEAAAPPEPPAYTSWDDAAEDPDAWKAGTEYEDPDEPEERPPWQR